MKNKHTVLYLQHCVQSEALKNALTSQKSDQMLNRVKVEKLKKLAKTNKILWYDDDMAQFRYEHRVASIG